MSSPLALLEEAVEAIGWEGKAETEEHSKDGVEEEEQPEEDDEEDEAVDTLNASQFSKLMAVEAS